MDGNNPTQPHGIPIEQVLSMRSQGLSNNQITQNLQRDGYKTYEIFDAMNQADMKAGINPAPMTNQAPPGNPMNPNMEQGPMPPPMSSPEANTNTQDMQGPSLTPMDERIEEIAEAIIDEKWTDLLENVKKIIDWKEKTDGRIDRIEQKFSDIKDQFDKLHSSILDRIGQYDQNMSDVGMEIKALEKVFQKILPTLTENVNELSRISSDFKSKQ